MEETNKKNKDMKPESAVFVGCMFLGMGTGWFFGNLVIGMFIGMGIGFLARAAMTSKKD